MKEEKLNTLDSLNDGFKIKRDGQIITLTSQEMYEFRMLNMALDGRDTLECWSEYINEQDIIRIMINDEETCLDFAFAIQNCLGQDSSQLELDIINEFIEERRGEMKK